MKGCFIYSPSPYDWTVEQKKWSVELGIIFCKEL
jgi:hypothetical protein